MLTNENGRKTKRLSREILGLLLITAVIALFFWLFISDGKFHFRNLFHRAQPAALRGTMADIASMDSQCEPAFDGYSVSGAVSVPAGAEAGVSEGNHTGGGCPAHTPFGGCHSAARGE